MRVEAQTYLKTAEKASAIAFFDIEASGLASDYNSVLCVSVKPFGKHPKTFAVTKPGDDKGVVEEAVAHLRTFDVIVGYYSKGFDVPMLEGRLLYHGLPDFNPKQHLDMYFQLRWKIKTSRRSQGHLASWLNLPEDSQKMGVPAGIWNEVLRDPARHMPTMVKRCESDTRGLEALYKRTRHLIRG